MNKQLKPWDVRGSDFSRQGWHTKPTAAYMLLFEFLRLSPSYELARVHRTQGLTNEQKKTLPADFKQVLKIYDRLGDVQTTMFRRWWQTRGLRAFGNPYSRPKVHQIALLAEGQDISPTEVSNDLGLFLNEIRPEEGSTKSLLISIPVGGRRSDVLRQINKLLEQHKPPKVVAPKPPTEQLQLMGKRFHGMAIFSGVRLLWLKAAKPKWENWRLGTLAKLSPSYADALDYNNPRKPATPIELDDRITMGKITSRALKRFEYIAENAARGKFPCATPIECSPFNYPQLATRIKKTRKWEKAEKDRLTKLHQMKIKQLLTFT